MSDLRGVQRALGLDWALARYRLDGAKVIHDFEASGHTYDAPQVLVLDYTVIRIFPDGSSLELTHNIFRVQSQEAANDLGEFHPPDGADILTLHTVKADGRRIEPDVISGKSSISLPNLTPNDYVEFEYVRAADPPHAFPNGYLGDRFYFESFEVPFDRSEETLIMPKDMHPLVDPRGPAPHTEEHLDGNLRVLHWGVHQSRPLVAEPDSVSAREFIPSINVGIHATWAEFVDGLRDVLADRDPVDPAARRQALQILGDAKSADDLTKAKKLYAWVLANIESSNDTFGVAPAQLADRTGNRARVLAYMLRLVGVPAKLVIARSAGTDQTRSALPDDETYTDLVVMIGGAHHPIFLATGQRGAPFGYLPPALRGQDGIVLAEGAPRVQLPAGRADEDLREVHIDATLRANGSAHLDVVETFHGTGAVSWRDQLEGIPRATLHQRFEEAYVARIVPGASLGSLHIVGREHAEEPLSLHYGVDVSSFGRRSGNQWLVPALYPAQLASSYATQPTRTTTELVAPGVAYDVTVDVHVPHGTHLGSTPSDVTLHSRDGIHFTLRAHPIEGGVHIARSVRIPLMRITPDHYRGFAGFCRNVDQAEARELPVRLH